MWKWHDPKVVSPVAVLPSELIEKVGVAEALVKATVVVDVVPKEVTPDGNWKAVFGTKATVAAEAGRTVSAAAACTCAVPPPPPHATSVLATKRVNMALRIFFMIGTFHL